MKKEDNDNFSEEFLENLLKGNRVSCSEIAAKYLKDNHSYIDLYEEIFKTSLYEIGLLWETNRISVAKEHLSTAITEGILNELFEQVISKNRLNRRVVVACASNEQHQVGAKMVADTFEMQGWESFFLGTGIPDLELIRYIREINPNLIAISLSVYFNFANLLRLIEKIREAFPGLQIIVGGQAFNHVPVERVNRLEDVLLIPDLYFLEKYINLLNSNLDACDYGKN